nr:histidine kinase [Anaerobacillus isosaccharinicus]QOY38267.1 histidine kinase [Anaerobacillus isosaccharinicus]
MNPKKAQELIVNLAAFFRKTLKNNDDLLPFSEEMQIINLYLSIQKARFGDKLALDIQINNHCLDIPFPTFVLQQLVENSMNHGFNGNTSIMNLFISAHIEKNQFSVQLRDNGSGFPERIIEAVKSDTKDETMGIGLTNIKRRLKSLYGENYVFELKNTAKGSLVIIKIPCEQGRT